MYTWQKQREEKVVNFMNQWQVSKEVATAYLEAEEWIYWEACVSYRCDKEGEVV